METAKREMTFLTAEPERRLLRWTAARLPRSWMPDHLTMIGVLGALTVGVGYYLSPRHPGWLWIANLGLVMNWFGDSLDGTLARVRQIERPKYGYYLDHMVDAINTAIIGAAIGLSPYVSLPVAMVLVILYLCLSINVYLESSVFGLFELGFGIFGPHGSADPARAGQRGAVRGRDVGRSDGNAGRAHRERRLRPHLWSPALHPAGPVPDQPDSPHADRAAPAAGGVVARGLLSLSFIVAWVRFNGD